MISSSGRDARPEGHTRTVGGSGINSVSIQWVSKVWESRKGRVDLDRESAVFCPHQYALLRGGD